MLLTVFTPSIVVSNMSKENPYYPNPHLKKDMFPYTSVQELYEEVSNLYNAACRLKVLPDWKAQEVEVEVYEFFKNDELDKKMREENYIGDDDDTFVPDSLQNVYPALPDTDKEAFLYTLRGVIQEKLG
jgi:hypothetical protein